MTENTPRGRAKLGRAPHEQRGRTKPPDALFLRTAMPPVNTSMHEQNRYRVVGEVLRSGVTPPVSCFKRVTSFKNEGLS